ncbi:class I SAM-dependent methyltransferase [Actinosynnema sp. NPDC050436]|uniref:class I SAM-dependent DNA methyltransferase n=1 Tax=Actinosynnema sp. NPDC050436 TaxID=3155659 RepID=UPI0033F48C8B
MFGRELAEVYDLVYTARGQDFAAESADVVRIVRDARPGAASLLDVGCGTAEHLRHLVPAFDHVEGVDLSADMLAVGRRKLPDVPLHHADMRDLRLGRCFDAVISLSTAVAYLPSRADLARALTAMAAHATPGGVLVVEPWYFPENFLDGHVAGDALRVGPVTVTRLSHTRGLGGAARIVSHYAVADASGIEHFTETQDFGLWTREEYLAAFRVAGCTARYLPDVQSGRGVFVARHRTAPAGVPAQNSGQHPRPA